MRSVLAVGLIVALSAALSQGQMTLVDNGFDDYDLGTVHQQGDDGYGTARWAVQQNSSTLADTTYVTVQALAEDPANLAVELKNLGRTGLVDTIYACMSLGTLSIYQEGTIYLRFKADGPNDTIMGTNDLWAHWDYGTLDTGDASSRYFQQTANNYDAMGVLIRLSAGEEFRSCDGTSGDRFVDMGQATGAWQELWIQVDQANDRMRYYLCEDGQSPALVPNPADGGAWWAMWNGVRNNDAVANLKFFVGGQPIEMGEKNVVLESVAIDPNEMTVDHYAGWAPIPAGLRADFDGDGDVDLDDFVILK
ncbi:MAG: hypothetical protein GX591_15785, partial [Planctomycetes bacterium]|nr:hypothetical protein [Planctomycetota bacterium]